MSPLVLAALLAAASALPASAQALKVAEPIYGVTVDDLTNLNAISASLAALPKKPTVRVVFDPDTPASSYVAPLRTLRHDAFIVGEIMDSYYFPQTPEQLDKRVKELVAALKDEVDIWEIANEINGEWLRANPDGPEATAVTQEQQIGEMVLAAYNTVKAAGGRTMVTLYYNQDPKGESCGSLPIDNWRTWPKQFLPETVRAGADYAMLSYYPYQDCQGLKPDWAADFALLESVFPNAKVGFGEIGTSMVNAPKAVQTDLLKTYYSMAGCRLSPRFVGGVFWWNYAQQMTPHGSSDYWKLLRETIADWSSSPATVGCAKSPEELAPESPTVKRRARRLQASAGCGDQSYSRSWRRR